MKRKNILAFALAGLLALSPLASLGEKSGLQKTGNIAYAETNKKSDLQRLKESLDDLKASKKGLYLIKDLAPKIVKKNQKAFDDIDHRLDMRIANTEKAIKILSGEKVANTSTGSNVSKPGSENKNPGKNPTPTSPADTRWERVTKTVTINGKTYLADVTQGPVKGNSKSMIYHVMGQRDYDHIAVENCVRFASQKEAEKAGYRAAKR